ncbi:MAG: hypothetical protein V2A34_04575 [Lentisphaerota bacterium]
MKNQEQKTILLVEDDAGAFWARVEATAAQDADGFLPAGEQCNKISENINVGKIRVV